jgi:hypothetical protein
MTTAAVVILCLIWIVTMLEWRDVRRYRKAVDEYRDAVRNLDNLVQNQLKESQDKLSKTIERINVFLGKA